MVLVPSARVLLERWALERGRVFPLELLEQFPLMEFPLMEFLLLEANRLEARLQQELAGWLESQLLEAR